MSRHGGQIDFDKGCLRLKNKGQTHEVSMEKKIEDFKDASAAETKCGVAQVNWLQDEDASTCECEAGEDCFRIEDSSYIVHSEFSMNSLLKEWDAQLLRSATTHDCARMQQPKIEDQKRITLMQISEGSLLQDQYESTIREQMNLENICNVSPPTTMNMKKCADEREILNVVNQVLAPEKHKEHLFRLLMKHRTIFTNYPGKCSVFEYNIKLTPTDRL